MPGPKKAIEHDVLFGTYLNSVPRYNGRPTREFVAMRSEGDQRAAVLITSNLPFDEGTETFGSACLTGALLDRLTHHVHILDTEGTQTVFTGQSTIWRRWGLVQGDAKLDFDPPTADEDVLDDQPQ